MANTKREERKQRSEEHKAEQERLAKKKQARSRAMFVVVLIVIGAAGYLVTSRHPKDGEERNGRIWSAAHGHWHDRFGAEIR